MKFLEKLFFSVAVMPGFTLSYSTLAQPGDFLRVLIRVRTQIVNLNADEQAALDRVNAYLAALKNTGNSLSNAVAVATSTSKRAWPDRP